MIKGSYDMLCNLAKLNVCAKCGQPVVVASSPDGDGYCLRCADCPYPDVLTKQPSLTELWKQGEELPETIAHNIEKRQRRKAMTQGKQVVPFILGGIPNTDLATGEMLSPEAIHYLVEYAYKYKLDPYRGHVVMMYGSPYIGLDGYLFHAHQQKRPYTLESRPMTTDEEKQYKVGPTDHAWLAWVKFSDTGESFSGVGIVTYDEMTAKSKKDNTKLRSPVVAAHPWQLAQKRADWQALRRAFPIGDVLPPSDSPPPKEGEGEIDREGEGGKIQPKSQQKT